MFLLLAGASMSFADSQLSETNGKANFPCDPTAAAHYTAYRTIEKIDIDGRLTEKCWKSAPPSPRFTDILTGKPALYDTRAAVLWDDENLYVGYWVEEPKVKATLTEYGSHIYENNDVEVFIAGKDAYYEFEINALNTVYEAFFIWEEAYDRDGFSAAPEFKSTNPNVIPFNVVGFTTHPRGPRLGSWAFKFPGLKTAVRIDGTLNNDNDKDKGWTVELCFPWKGMEWLAKADGRSLPPHDGDIWRIDFSRFNQYKAPPPAQDSGGWFWSRHGIWDSHIPECFPYIHFSTKNVRDASASKK
jgi:hypothetical protein